MAYQTGHINGSARQFVDDLAANLAQSQPRENTANPLNPADTETKHTLLTLHALFPNELLPALDLLDRGLVLKLSVSSENVKEEMVGVELLESNAATAQREKAVADTQSVARDEASNDKTFSRLYFVRSAQQQHARPKWRDMIEQAVHYEVRLDAWNCSCPAFAFAVFPAAPSTGSMARLSRTMKFGGSSLGDDLPICKHLLACFLAEHIPMFRSMVDQKVVSRNEAIAWAAGWSD